MTLSERERKLLEEMERGFYMSEADVMSTSRTPNRTVNYRALTIGLLIALAGIGVIVLAVAMQQMWLGVIGFIAMILGISRVLTPGKNAASADQQPRGGGSASARPRPRARESLADRMERRWDQRMNGER